MRTPIILALIAATATFLSPREAHAAGDDPVMKAMTDELARSLESLRVENLDRPYFIAYRVDEIQESGAHAILGSLARSGYDRRRSLTVEVRVGSPALDNSNFLSTSMRGSAGMSFMPGDDASLTIEDNYAAIRRKLWLATDAAYKQALEDLSGKRAALQNKNRTETIPDLSPALASVIEGSPPEPPHDAASFETLARDLSALFRVMPGIVESSVDVGAQTTYTRYVNSEGTRYTRAGTDSRFVATADGYAADGLPAGDFVAAFGRVPGDLPPKETLAAAIRDLGERVRTIGKADLIDTYNGPVIFEGQAAAALWARAFLPAILASPPVVSDNPQMEAYLAMQSPPSLADRVGARVLPGFMNVIDDPGAAGRAPDLLLGGYPVDDDGVPARKTSVVEAGILKTLLGTRQPASGATATTGNRRGDGACPSNVLVTSSGGLTDKALRQRLAALVKERGLAFGVIVRRMDDDMLHPGIQDPMARFMSMRSPGAGSPASPIIAAYRVDSAGRETPLRNLEITGIEPGVFKDIVATSKSATVITLPFAAPASPFGGGRNSNVPLITISTPAVLLEDVTLKKTGGNLVTPPIAANPNSPG